MVILCSKCARSLTFESIVQGPRVGRPQTETSASLLEGAAATKIRNYRNLYRQTRQVAFLPACMSTSGRIQGELLHLLFSLANKRADDYFQALGYQPQKQ